MTFNVSENIKSNKLFRGPKNCYATIERLSVLVIFKELCNGTVLRVFQRSQTWKWGIPVIRFSEDEEMRKDIYDEDRSRKVSQYQTFDFRKKTMYF